MVIMVYASNSPAVNNFETVMRMAFKLIKSP